MSDLHDGINENGGDIRLSDLDAEALQQLIENGFDPRSVPDNERATRLAGLMALLDGPVEQRDPGVLADVTMARIAQISKEETSAVVRTDPALTTLTPLDEEAVDAMMLAELDADDTPNAVRERAEQVEAIGALITAPTPINESERAARIERTLAAIDADSREQSQRLTLNPAASGSGFRLQDLVSVAAMLLLGAAIAWPVVGTLRQRAEMATGRSNLASAGAAFGSYAGDNQSAFPMYSDTATAGMGGAPLWWSVGQDPARSNSANLYTLPRLGYVNLEALASPGNPDAVTDPLSATALDWQNIRQVSYSYRIMTGTDADASWGALPDMVVLADRSPVVLRAIENKRINPFENSPNHDGRGQLLLKADGSVEWVESPWLESGDNIWLPRIIEKVIHEARDKRNMEPISGTEVPSDPTDSFVGP